MLWFIQVSPENVLLEFLCQKRVLYTSHSLKLQTLMWVSIICSWCHTSTLGIQLQHSVPDGSWPFRTAKALEFSSGPKGLMPSTKPTPWLKKELCVKCPCLTCGSHRLLNTCQISRFPRSWLHGWCECKVDYPRNRSIWMEKRRGKMVCGMAVGETVTSSTAVSNPWKKVAAESCIPASGSQGKGHRPAPPAMWCT